MKTSVLLALLGTLLAATLVGVEAQDPTSLITNSFLFNVIKAILKIFLPSEIFVRIFGDDYSGEDLLSR